jgi:hypothetical protein
MSASSYRDRLAQGAVSKPPPSTTIASVGLITSCTTRAFAGALEDLRTGEPDREQRQDRSGKHDADLWPIGALESIGDILQRTHAHRGPSFLIVDREP